MSGGLLPVSIAKETRLEYFEALESYAVGGNLRPFAEMIADLEENRLDEFLSISERRYEAEPAQSPQRENDWEMEL